MNGNKFKLKNSEKAYNITTMSTTKENQKKAILNFFNNLDEDYWKTIEEISTSTNINTSIVADIVISSGDFVRSSYRVKHGEPLYTSRLNFRNKAPLVDKLIGAFKNRID